MRVVYKCFALLLLSGAFSVQPLAGGLVDIKFEDVTFTNATIVDNPYWPLTPGTVYTYFAETEDGCEWNVVDVTGDTYLVAAGVEGVVVLDMEWADETEGCSESDYDPAAYDPFDPFN